MAKTCSGSHLDELHRQMFMHKWRFVSGNQQTCTEVYVQKFQ